MSHENVAVVLLLVFATISTNPVIGAKCSVAQKAFILNLCRPYISKRVLLLPPQHGTCCQNVRSLQKFDATMMLCIAGLLNSGDLQNYDVRKVQNLPAACK
jgi:hypothetical protein